MDFDEYQAAAIETAVYPGQGGFIGLTYAALGLNGEAGETGEQVKKLWRDDVGDPVSQVTTALKNFHLASMRENFSFDTAFQSFADELQGIFAAPIDEERRDKIISELGDTLWYAAQVATELGIDLSDVAELNLEKLAERRRNNTIHGDGENRVPEVEDPGIILGETRKDEFGNAWVKRATDEEEGAVLTSDIFGGHESFVPIADWEAWELVPGPQDEEPS